MRSALTKKLILLLVVCITAIGAAAQTRTLSGEVVEKSGDPLVGVSVFNREYKIGITTDINGKFEITLPSGVKKLTFSYIGYQTLEIDLKPNENKITVTMTEDAQALDEVVVVGYGTQKKVNLTGAVSVITDKELSDRPSQSLTSMLQGTTPGLNITTGSGLPNKSPSINVRGTTSVNATNPLVLVDGVEGDLSQVNPSDVKSISVVKDASAAAIYGARAAFGVILVTTKAGESDDATGKRARTTVRYSGRFGWEANTNSTDYEDRGYWAVYTANLFARAKDGKNIIDYTDKDMAELLARVNDRTEHPDRPWIVEDVRNGKKQWVYYGNYDHYHMNFSDNRPKMQHNISLSGGIGDVNYFVSGAYEYRKGILKVNPDTYNKYNLRSKIEFPVTKWARFSNNTSLYSTSYKSQGNGSIEDTFGYSANGAFACYPNKNPDGTWIYSVPYQSTKMANGRHIMIGEGSHRNLERNMSFINTSRFIVTPIKQLSITGDFSYKFDQDRNYWRSNHLNFRMYPDSEMDFYGIGAGQNKLTEQVYTSNYISVNAYANYNQSWNDKHNLAATFGFNYEHWHKKNLSAVGYELSSDDLDDLNLATTMFSMGGGQNEYKLAGWFGRVNYDYDGRYLAEISGRYDGTSRFASNNRWGFFPSGSVGWRISEEKFMEWARPSLSNLKFRVSYGSLGNQNVSSFYTFLRMITLSNFDTFNFGSDTKAKYSSIGAPIAQNLTWETARQWNIGADLAMFNNRLNFTGDIYVRNTVNMLTDGIELPGVYGATPPQMNTADLRTKGYELSATWRDNLKIFGHNLSYSVSANLSNYDARITRYDNPEKVFAKKYYPGMKLGEIWGYHVDGLFASDEEAAQYSSQVDLGVVAKNLPQGIWMAGDLKFADLDGDGKISIGEDSALKPGDRKIIGNELPTLQYGFSGSLNYMGFDIYAFFQGTGNHYWYPNGYNYQFWGSFSDPVAGYIPRNFIDQCWSKDNPGAYFPRPLGQSAKNGQLSFVNDRYLQNIRYMRFKNLTIGYSIPEKILSKVSIKQLRVYFTAENLCYWSPIKKHSKYIDPEAAFSRTSNQLNAMYYPWAKTYMFGIDITL